MSAPEDSEASMPNIASEKVSISSKTPDLAPLEPVHPKFQPSRAFYLTFVALALVTLAAAIDSTSLSIALPIIATKLNGSAIEAFWAGTSFLLSSAISQPVIAGLSHVFGRKSTIMGSAVFFAVGSIVAAVANNFTTILVGRTIQGIGGGGIITLGEILLTDLVPLAQRGAWLGYLGSMWAIGTVTGPLMGGAFAQNVTWRWIFWINLPLIGAGAGAMFLFLHLDPVPGTLLYKVKMFDWIGSVIFGASSVSFLVPLTWGGVMYSWSSWHTLVPLLVSILGLVLFILYELRLTRRAYDSEGGMLPGDNPEPIIRFSIFNNATMWMMYIETIIHGIILWSLLYYLPLYYEGVKGYTPIIAGVAVLPETTFVAPMSIIVGVVCSMTGKFRWAIWIGWTITTLGSGILILMKPETTIIQWVFLNIPVAIGCGMLFPAMSIGLQAAGRPQDNGHAVAFFSFVRVVGQALGVAIGGVVFQNQLAKKLAGYPLLAPMAGEYSKDAAGLVVIINAMPSGTLEKTQLIKAFSDSIRMIWVVVTALSAFGLFTTFFAKSYSMNQEHATRQHLNEEAPKGRDLEAPGEN